jgi:hypothetical protein
MNASSPSPAVKHDFQPAAGVPGEYEPSAQPMTGGYWRRLCRAVAILMAAVGSHLWLVRAPQTPDTARASQAAVADARPNAVDSQNTGIIGPETTPRVRSRNVRVVIDMIGVPAPSPARDVTSGSTPVFSTVGFRRAAATAQPHPASLGGTTQSFPAGTTGMVEVADSRTPEELAPRVPEIEAAPVMPPETQLPASVANASRAVASAALDALLPPAVAAPRARPVAERKPADSTADVRTQEQIVLEVLHRYSRAFENMDVQATKAVWPSVDDRELRRVYRQFDAQQVRFASCGVSINGPDANARCRGSATYRPKVGSRVQLKEREWTFNLSRDDAGWQIVNQTIH